MTENIFHTHGKIRAEERTRLTGHPGCVIWLTGLSASGKSTIAVELERSLCDTGRFAYVLDGDNIRHGLCSDLGFSPEHRQENIRRVGEVAKLFADVGLICITAFISPYRSDRELARGTVAPAKFLEVYVNAPLAVCEQRDPKGLYAKARAGKLKEFTGISAPYEAPLKPEIELRTGETTVKECIANIFATLDPILGQKRP